jgi:hypothetical protein
LRFQEKSKFYRVWLSAPRLTPNLENQGTLVSSYRTAGIALRILRPRLAGKYSPSQHSPPVQLHHQDDLTGET